MSDHVHLKPKTRLLRDILRRERPNGLTNQEITQLGVGYRFSARLLELRKAGYIVQRRSLTATSNLYTLTGEPGSGEGCAASTDGAHLTRPATTDADALLPSVGPRSAIFESDFEAA